MKAVPGVTTTTDCRKCGTQGKPVDYSSPMVTMQCHCGYTWRTLSAICPQCRRPSGTPYWDDCPTCKVREEAG